MFLVLLEGRRSALLHRPPHTIIARGERLATKKSAPKSVNLFGRRKIFVDTDDINAGNIRDILKDVLPAFHLNQYESEYLYEYYKGNQPVLQRQKFVRPEINNKLVENHAYEIVTFKTSYLFGEPLTYARRSLMKGADDSGENNNEVTRRIAELNNIMYRCQKAAVDKEIADWMHICGRGYRFIVPDSDEGIQIGSLDPRNTEVCYSRSLGNPPVMAFQEIVSRNEPVKYEVFTKNRRFLVQEDSVVEEKHAYGALPIVEYPANSARLGAFEVVLSLLDAINLTTSNRLDAIEQFVQGFLRCINVKIDKELWSDLRDEGLLQFQSDSTNPSSVDFISQELNQGEAQIEVEHLYQQALIICGMPDRNGANRTTGDTGQAVILRDGWTAAESCARDTQISFERAEKDFLRFALKILRDKNLLDLDVNDVAVKFTKNNTDNILTKAQALQIMLECDIHPEWAIKKSNLFDDPNRVYLDSKPYLEQAAAAAASQKLPNDAPEQNEKQNV